MNDLTTSSGGACGSVGFFKWVLVFTAARLKRGLLASACKPFAKSSSPIDNLHSTGPFFNSEDARSRFQENDSSHCVAFIVKSLNCRQSRLYRL